MKLSKKAQREYDRKMANVKATGELAREMQRRRPGMPFRQAVKIAKRAVLGWGIRPQVAA